MEGYLRNDEVVHPQLLDLIPKEREWTVNRGEERKHGIKINCEEKKLELRLGPPGDEEDWTIEKNGTKNNFKEREHQSLLSLGYFSKMAHNTLGSKRGFLDTQAHAHAHAQKFSSGFPGNKQPHQQTQVPYLSLPVMGKESSQPCCNKLVVELQSAEKKTFSPDSANTAVPNTSQKRSAPAPVVGWPPIRSFRKNLASSSTSKPLPESQNVVPKNAAAVEKQVESSPKGYFVKINMDGVPIGRKVDLKAYDSYEKLSSSVDQLFRSLLAAQKDLSSAGGIKNKEEGEKAITGLLDGSGEYTLVYEDNEGDRMLVGDVPWHMFVSTVKRLRVLKSSELSKLFVGNKQEKNPFN